MKEHTSTGLQKNLCFVTINNNESIKDPVFAGQSAGTKNGPKNTCSLVISVVYFKLYWIDVCLPRIRKKNEIRMVIVILVVSLNQTEILRATNLDSSIGACQS